MSPSIATNPNGASRYVRAIRSATAAAWRPPLPVSPTAANLIRSGVDVHACGSSSTDGAAPGMRSSRANIDHALFRPTPVPIAPVTPNPPAMNWRRESIDISPYPQLRASPIVVGVSTTETAGYPVSDDGNQLKPICCRRRTEQQDHESVGAVRG